MRQAESLGWFAVLEKKQPHLFFSRIAHVMPLGDWRQHERSIACWCAPKPMSHDGGTVVLHNAADGREVPKME